MRIALISGAQVACPPFGYGSEARTWDLALALAAVGHEVLLFAPAGSGHGHRISHFQIPGPMDCSPFNGGQLRAAEAVPYWRFGHELRACDVVHDFSITFRTHELLMSHGWRRSLFTLNGIGWGEPALPIARKHAVVVSRLAQAAALGGWHAWMDTPYDNGGLDAGPPFSAAKVVRYGCDVNFYAPNSNKVDERIDVLYVGRPHQAKGIALFLSAAEMRPDLNFVLAWRAALQDHRDKERAFLEQAAKLKNVRFEELPTGPTHHMRKRDLMAVASVFLHPAIYLDACPSCVIEAQACGTPVVAFDRGGTPEIVVDGETAVLVRYRKYWADTATYNATIVDLVDAIDRARVLDRSRVREYAVQDLSSKRMAADYLALYQDLIDDKDW